MDSIANELKTQDNRITDSPIFLVYYWEKVPTDSEYSDDYYYQECADDYCAFDTIGEVYEYHGDPKPDELDEDDMLDKYDCISKIAYIKKKVFLQPFFTEKAANAYMKRMEHRYKGMFTYVDSLNDNPEMKAIRNFLLNYEEEI